MSLRHFRELHAVLARASAEGRLPDDVRKALAVTLDCDACARALTGDFEDTKISRALFPLVQQNFAAGADVSKHEITGLDSPAWLYVVTSRSIEEKIEDALQSGTYAVDIDDDFIGPRDPTEN